jgi:hypothetical protein
VAGARAAGATSAFNVASFNPFTPGWKQITHPASRQQLKASSFCGKCGALLLPPFYGGPGGLSVECERSHTFLATLSTLLPNNSMSKTV